MLFRPANECALRKNARLRYPLQDDRGVLLLAQGAEINDRVYNLLQTRGIQLSMSACLKVCQGGPPGLEIPLVKEHLLIGRRPDCDVQLPNALVSGHHCSIERRLAGVFVHDLHSANGTFLNDETIKGETELSDGDVLRIADTILSVHIFAALAADSQNGANALKAWIFDDAALKRRPASPYCPTEMDIELPPE